MIASPLELAGGKCILAEDQLVVHARIIGEVCLLVRESTGKRRAAIGLVSRPEEASGILQRLLKSLDPASARAAKLVAGAHATETIARLRRALSEAGVPVEAEDVGGTSPRDLFAFLPEGRLRVSAAVPDSKASSSLRESASRPTVALVRRRVLIVEDARTVRELLGHIIERESSFCLVAKTESAESALRTLNSESVDVVILDLNLPGMDGLSFLEHLPHPENTAVVIVSSVNRESGKVGLRAFELGAFEYLEKPSLSEMENMGTTLVEAVRNAAPVAHCRRLARIQHGPKAVASTGRRRSPGEKRERVSLVAVGASTGGTNAIREFFIDLPKEVPPILVVQHIPPVFSRAFAEELNRCCAFEVKEAEDGDAITAGRALIAPGAVQMKLIRDGTVLRVRITDDAPVNRHKPSVDYLFQSIADARLSGVVAFLLTGMGTDGAQGLLTLHRQGARTFAQNEQTCVVYGMPRAAVELGAADEVLPLEEMAEAFVRVIS